jgi:formate hydrogenlyase subunit 3/multisubunit Na+/H+ antiporter MnhD subunit
MTSPGGPVFTGTHPSIYNPPHASPGKTNPWCAWGFALSLAGLLFCGLPAPFGFVASVIGLVQVNRRRDQQGRSLAISGILISLVIMAILLVGGLFLAYSSIRGGIQTTTEQTSNDSDTR